MEVYFRRMEQCGQHKQLESRIRMMVQVHDCSGLVIIIIMMMWKW